MRDLRFTIVTGLSGAGKTLALRALEDVGYFCVDNLPPRLLSKFAELVIQQPTGAIDRVALGMDIRGGEFFEGLVEAVEELKTMGFPHRILFLEADDETLVRRFKETRRLHPLAPHGGILEGIAEERTRLQPLRELATHVLDTSGWTLQDLRQEVFAMEGAERRLIINVLSFGFKHGLPVDADLVFDLRFLPNPNHVASLQAHDGNYPGVADYVLARPVARKFLRRLMSLLDFLLPHFLQEGRTQLTIALGCTGGRHRSVVFANRVAAWLKRQRHGVILQHRDIRREDTE
ncbi:MAG TPA: RNase adapter RapZ [Bacillota bacterium]|nr:RNase adapter RapZ [Bacillota bacterium]